MTLRNEKGEAVMIAVKRGMMRRSGIVCGLAAETNGILSANTYQPLNFIKLLFTAVR